VCQLTNSLNWQMGHNSAIRIVFANSTIRQNFPTIRRTPFHLVDVIVSIRINCNKVVPVLDDERLFW
jgi:hypothetical protein